MRLPTTTSGVVSEILFTYAGRQLSLNRTGEEAWAALALVRDAAADHLFPHARAPVEAHAGLLLWLGDWTRAHDIADIESPDAYYWHGILHRIEPAPSNAAYWFRKVERHPIFPELRESADAILHQVKDEEGIRSWDLEREWNPFEFIRWCEEARQHPGSAREKAARRIQQAEWDLLFSWCTQPAAAI